MSANILIGADLVPTKSNEQLFTAGDIDRLVDNGLKEKLEKADYRIFNLETPLTSNVVGIPKTGPCIRAARETINGIKKLDPSLLAMANNHILDFGEVGLLDTVKLLDEHNIEHIGAGKSLGEAAKPAIFTLGGVRVCVYACAEHEFTIASENSGGANPFDPLETPDEIADLKERCDYLIVLYHGGKEHYRYPSPMLQKICRKLISKGADIVICQHSHCIGCEEKFENGTIVYGQGNFLFDCTETECWQTSLLIDISLDDKKVNYIPICKDKNAVKLANERRKAEILNAFFERSEKISNPAFLQAEYEKLAAENVNRYLLKTRGESYSLGSRIYGKIFKHELPIKKKYTRRSLLALQNIVECETHRELFLAGLADEIKEK